MGLFSFFRKDRQESSARDSDFYSRADEEQQTGRSRRKGKRDQPVDPVLPEKKRARRRLVGAVALVLAAVIGLPMILDSEPRPLSDDISIQIPSKDTPPVTARADSKPAASADDSRASLGDGEEVVEPPKPAAKPASETPAVTATPAPAPVPAAPPAPPPVAKVEPPKPPQPPAIDKSDTSAEAARARAILEGKPPAADKPAKPAAAPAQAAAPAGSGKVALQVAALASQDKVNELQKKLQAAGLKSYTQKVSTAAGDRIRVRVGPFANEAEAEKARAKLSAIGLSGTMTAH
ncbi:sporulation protein [Oxalicibacterium flavum]|uniref:Sporulation protein n=1 Tax=Oxalicibacterium flavum TaxID=179467 RepID=A0A8J2UPK9_9BURK|nr:SPOR domain-containing protein [Oxalicibacterium flavum]GGC04573.1 sporulation protein [Oxalicibacterium flavum]